MAKSKFTKLIPSLILVALGAASAGCTITKYYATDPAQQKPAGQNAASARGSGSASASASGSVTAATHEGSAGGAVECHGGDSVTISDRIIDTPGNGVEAHGGCKVTLIRCQIRAGMVGIEAHGGSQITLRDSNVEGQVAAFELHGASSVDAANSRVRGRVEKHGGSTLRDLGGNAWQ